MYTRHLVSAIALLRVVEDIKFSSAIQPITLSSSTNFPVGKTATVIGWDADMCMAGEKELEIIPQENCTELYTICIWDKIDPLFSVPCYRLLGNPLTLNSIQIGIISDNTTCSFSRNSYTMVGLHIDWIKENAGRITVSAGNQVYPNTWIVLSHAILMLLSYSYSRL
ncbi:chymotrypsin-2 [Megachile rotundata]|uniref:chymotrypsin-2 n=1 Tax=Megachile rotundata TaxID=143995 RepID=UPI003FCF0DAE